MTTDDPAAGARDAGLAAARDTAERLLGFRLERFLGAAPGEPANGADFKRRTVTCLGSEALMAELPGDLPIVERDAVRLVVRDTLDRVLLFHTHELGAPEFGEWWELPGGGIDPGETYREAAVRELREETGIVAVDAQVGVPTWTRDGSFLHRRVRRLQHEVVVQVRLRGPGPDIDDGGRLDYEKEDYFGFRWWPVAEVAASTDRFYPGQLPRLLTRFLAGETLDEPLEVWS